MMAGQTNSGSKKKDKKRIDETIYCERCGISFLWTSEEQSESDGHAPEKPALCPGCRHLLPQPGRERGLVKWFNHKKRYGFIVRMDQEDLFFHRSELVTNARLHPGDLVEFAVSEGERGPAATEIMVLQHSSAAQSCAAAARHE
jgi:CspA family cold shock protein